MIDSDVVYTVPEVAEILKTSRSSVYRMIKEGDLEVVRVRAYVRVLARSVRKLVGE